MNHDYYDGFDLSSLLVVEAIRRPVMSPRSNDTTDIPGRDGCVHRGARAEAKTIELDVSILSLFSGSMRQSEFERKRRELAGRLAKDHPCELVLHDAPDLMDMAILDGSTDLERLMHSGSTTLTFVCPDPRSYGETNILSSEGGTAACDVRGSAKTAPTIAVESASPFTVTIDGEDFVVLSGGVESSPVVIDCENHATTSAGQVVPIAITSDYPEWMGGVHTVACSLPFTVRWVERWL